jgi:sugar-specific transcriptional regulator TrmB
MIHHGDTQTVRNVLVEGPATVNEISIKSALPINKVADVLLFLMKHYHVRSAEKSFRFDAVKRFELTPQGKAAWQRQAK